MAGTGNLMQVTITGDIAGQFCQNVLHAQFEPTGTADPFLAAVSVASAATINWLPDYLACLPASYTASSIRVKELAPDGGPTYTQTSGVAGQVGSRSDEISVMTVGPLVCFPVVYTRSVVGKIFLPGVAEADIGYGVLNGDIILACQTLIDTLLTPETISGTTPGTMTYCVAKVDFSDWKVPLAGYVSPTIGTQRRRSKPIF